MKNKLILFCFCLVLIGCSKENNQQITVQLSSEKEVLNFVLEHNSINYQTTITDTTINVNKDFPFGTKLVQIKSIEISENATVNYEKGNTINIIDTNFSIVIKAEDETIKTFTLDFSIKEEEFTVVEFTTVAVPKNYNKPLYVHYMPWFQTPEVTGYWGIHWTMANKNPNNILSNGQRDIASHYYPLIEPYDSNDPDYLEYALTCMKLTGIDGILIDFYGSWDFNDYAQLLKATNAVIEMSKKVGLKFGIMYEDRTINTIINQGFGNRIDLAKEDIKYMNDNYFNSENYFRLDNNPVLLNFGPISLKTNDEWLDVLSSVDTEINLFPLAYHSQYYNLSSAISGEYAWVGQMNDNSFYDYSSHLDYVGGGAMFEFREFYEEGGWGDTGQVDFPNRNGELFRENLNRAKNADIDYLQLITWNDWGEGTAIEPSSDYKFQQLKIVQEFVGIEPNENDLELTTNLYQKRKEHKGKELENKKLDQVFYYLISLQIDKARTLLNEL